MMPLKKYTLSSDKQNYFGSKRKYDYHTGLDLFCDEDSEVYSIYTGVVTAIIEFIKENIILGEKIK